MALTAENVTTWAFGVAVLVFLWRLHVDVSNVKERLARIEGWIEGRFREGTASGQ